MTTVSALLKKLSDPSVIIELFTATLGKFDDAKGAADVIHEILTGRPLTDLPKLERAFRERSPYLSESLDVWHRMSPSDLRLLERFGDASASSLGLASFHPNGYVREEAIKRLARLKTGGEIPFLILRLNDWVPEVRNSAVGAIHSRLRPEYCRAFVASFLLLSRLKHAGRADHKETLAAVNQLLSRDECRADLLASLKSEDRFVRRAGFKLALNLKGLHLQQVAELALNDDDTAIRSWGAQAISSAEDAARFTPFLERLKQDRFMLLRRAALRILVKLNSPHVVDELRAALLDPHISIREEARYYLKKIEPTDFADFYRQQLLAAEGAALYPVINGLGETGSAADDRLVAPYTSHQSSKIRRTALKALASLNPNPHLELFMKALEDEVSSVSSQASKTLMRKTSLLSAARVWEVFRSSTHIHVKRNALSLIEKFSKWESIGYLVSGLCENDEDLVDLSRRFISGWIGGFNRSFSSPTTEQVTSFENALERCGELLDEETRRQLHFTLR